MNREVPRILPAESGIQRGMISIAFGGAETSPRRYFARRLIRRIRILHPADLSLSLSLSLRLFPALFYRSCFIPR